VVALPFFLSARLTSRGGCRMILDRWT
jgi:hypothetical protein